MGRVPRIAIVTHSLVSGGGTATLTRFLRRIVDDSGRYRADVISLATSAFDRASVRGFSPRSWVRGPLVESGRWCELPYRHVGAIFPEFEFQRYRARRTLDRLLREYDLLQFAVGIPAWMCVAEGLDTCIALWTATRTRADRANRIAGARGVRRFWLPLMTAVTERYERRALRRADCVFALSRYTYESLQSSVESLRLVVAPCGVDTTRFHPRTGDREGYILAVGRFQDPRKNSRLLLEGYSRLCERVTSVPDLVLVGAAVSAKEMRWLQLRGLAARVHVVGNVPDAELPELYRRAGLFVLTSHEEGLGIVILEAMASGLPVVSTRCGGPETVVVDGETGFLTPVGDTETMVDALRRLVESPALRGRMGRAGRRVAEERFSLGATGHVFLEKYDELLAHRGAMA